MKRNALLLAALFTLCGCGGEPQPSDGEPKQRPVVFASFHPLHYFAGRIAGELVDLRCPLPAGRDPRSFVPEGDAIAAMQDADLLLFNGAGFEGWEKRVSVPLSAVIETARPLRDELIVIADADRHSHGSGSAHTHEGVDPHTWVDPINAKAQARAIVDGLLRVLPEEEQALQQGYRELAADLDGLHDSFRELGALPEGEVLVCSHPTYNYLARRHGWDVVNVDLDPEAAPTEEDVKRVENALGEHRARFVLWEQKPTSAMAQLLRAELGLTSVVFDPGEGMPRAGEQDYLELMRANLERLEVVFTAER